MKTAELVEFAADLIRIPSVSGDETKALEFLMADFKKRGWKCETIPVADGRWNIFVPFGTPTICFSTHVDVVPAPDQLFQPSIKDGVLTGRGACDAKGILACMVACAERLLNAGETDFGLLFVVGEEQDGIGAKTAAKALKNRGIRYLVNGEPTEGKLIEAHKGGVTFVLKSHGRACHSGYPELGEDANAKILLVAGGMLEADFGYDLVLGKATINLGLIQGGTASNVVSGGAKLEGMVRTVTDNKLVEDQLVRLAGDSAELTVINNAPPVRLKTVPGLETGIASYCTDIPHFAPLNVECLLYGPGTISVAHTVNEQVKISELETAVEAYERIFGQLKSA